MIGMFLKIEIKAGMRDELVEFLKWDAAVAKSGEPNTLRFDVYPTDDENVIFLYEAYTDAAGFEEHKAGEPFQKFGEIRERCIESMEILTAGKEALASNY
jgi:autoinducer 2-degrading protein